MNTHSGPNTATGADTLIGVLNEAAERGYETQLIGRDNGRIECTDCGQQRSPADFDIFHARRLEGASDAADLLLVLWAPCPSCGRRGVLTLGYGPNASDEDTAIVEQLDLAGADSSPVQSTDASSDAPGEHRTEVRDHLNVLIGVDETAESREAVETAYALFGPDCHYTIVSIHERQPIVVGGFGLGTSLAGMHSGLDERVGRQLATNAASTARSVVPVDADVDFHTEVGHAGSAIAAAAVEHHSDIIVIGSHDRGIWERLFTPSVGKYLVDHAPCPVLVVR